MPDTPSHIEWFDAHPPHGIGDHPFWRGRLDGHEFGVYVCLVQRTGDGRFYTPFSSEGVDSPDFVIDGDAFILAWTDHVAWSIVNDAKAFAFDVAVLQEMIRESVPQQLAAK